LFVLQILKKKEEKKDISFFDQENQGPRGVTVFIDCVKTPVFDEKCVYWI